MPPPAKPRTVTGTNKPLHHGNVEISLYGIYGETKENHHLRQDSHGAKTLYHFKLSSRQTSDTHIALLVLNGKT